MKIFTPVGELAALEEVQQLRLGLEEVEEPTQALQVRGDVEAGSARRDHHVLAAFHQAPRCPLPRRLHERGDVAVQVQQLAADALVQHVDVQPGVVLVDVVGGLLQLRGL
jgi:hypothetical protein